MQRKPCLGALAQEGQKEEVEAGLGMMQSWTEGPLLTVFPVFTARLIVPQLEMSLNVRDSDYGGVEEATRS